MRRSHRGTLPHRRWSCLEILPLALVECRSRCRKLPDLERVRMEARNSARCFNIGMSDRLLAMPYRAAA